MALNIANCVTFATRLVNISSLSLSKRVYLKSLRLVSTKTTTDANEQKSEETEAKPSSADIKLSDVEKLHQDISALNEKLVETQDKYLRSLAEVENVRQRLKKQIDDAKIFGIQSFCKDLLDVADVLQNANASVPLEAVKTGDSQFRDLFEGLKLTEAQLQGVFSRHGLAQVYPLKGDVFDPHFHEALFEVPCNGDTAGTVAILQKVGYKLHDRTIRPAQVGVFKSQD